MTRCLNASAARVGRADKFGFDDKIPVYRKVTIPKNIDDLEKVITNYNGVGNYWTYEEDKAEAYNASNITNSQDITMKAYVNVSDVDWEITFDRTVYNLREEREYNFIRKKKN